VGGERGNNAPELAVPILETIMPAKVGIEINKSPTPNWLAPQVCQERSSELRLVKFPKHIIRPKTRIKHQNNNLSGQRISAERLGQKAEV
jgi:hypothetical protein